MRDLVRRRGFRPGPWAVLVASQAALAAPPAVPVEDGLVSVKIRVGLKDEAPSAWEGTYRVRPGRIIATAGWRFMGDDFATVERFKVGVRRWYPLFWGMTGRAPESFPLEPNGFILTLDGTTPSSVLELETSRGRFTVPLARLAYGQVRMALEGSAEVERVPTSRIVVAAPTEDAYPSAAAGPDGAIHAAYLAFTHGEGFRARPRLKEAPRDFAFLAAPTGGDRVMVTTLRDGRWTEPEAITPPGGDLYRTAVAVDGDGGTWVFWSANEGGNWDIRARVRRGAGWSDPIRVTRDPGPDIHGVAATDAAGRVWIAWQGFRKGQADIFVARQEGRGFGAPECVGGGPANEWTPAIACASDGRVAVAWDTYERGDYDVCLRIRGEAGWGPVRVVAGTRRNELRPSLAWDRKGRLWIAYEDGPEGWGKDFGPYDQAPTRMPLYRARRIGVRVLDGGALRAPAHDVNRALPMPHGGRRWPKSGNRVLAAGPRLAVDRDGRVWLAARVAMRRFAILSVGTTWMTFVTTLDPGGWRSAVIVPETDGLLHEAPALVPAPGDGLHIVSSSDGRFRSAAFHGPQPWKRRRRSRGVPPATTRGYAVYPDIWANEEIAVADTGRVPTAGEPRLVEVPGDPPHGPSPAARREAEHVAAIRAYRAEVGGVRLRILRGEFHRHTEISGDGGGDGSLPDMWRYALDLAALDWIGNGDHDNGGREFGWWITQKTTDIFHLPGRFTPLFTYERSVNYPDGHRNAVFARRGIRPLPRLEGGMGRAMDDRPDAPRPPTPDTRMFYAYLRAFDGICASHTSGTDMGTDWRDNDPRVEPVVEIYQGDRQSYERPGAPRANTAEDSIGGWRPLGFVARALRLGYRLGFQASSDHISTHMSYCNVYVEEPTREAILRAMRRRHVYGATDNIIADVRCGDHFLGDAFTVREPPTLSVKLIGTAPFARVVIVKDDRYVHSVAPKTRTVEFTWTDADARPGATSYYYVRGEQVGEARTRKVRSRVTGKPVEIPYSTGEIVWVSPMWITYAP